MTTETRTDSAHQRRYRRITDLDEQIDPTARIEDGAVIGEGTSIGPYCIIGPNVVIGANCKLIGACARHRADHDRRRLHDLSVRLARHAAAIPELSRRTRPARDRQGCTIREA
jgi:UDP-N-acetylglucosamine acyltransferase